MLHPIEEPGPDDGVNAAEPSGGNRSRGFRFSLRSILIATFVIALFLGLGPMLLLRVFFGVGPVWFRSSWPHELNAFMDALPESDRAKVSNVKVY